MSSYDDGPSIDLTDPETEQCIIADLEYEEENRDESRTLFLTILFAAAFVLWDMFMPCIVGA